MKPQIGKIRGTRVGFYKGTHPYSEKVISDSPMSKQTHIALFFIISI